MIAPPDESNHFGLWSQQNDFSNHKKQSQDAKEPCRRPHGFLHNAPWHLFFSRRTMWRGEGGKETHVPPLTLVEWFWKQQNGKNVFFGRLWPISCGRIFVVAVISQSDGCIEVQFLRAQSARSSTLILVEPKAGLGQSPRDHDFFSHFFRWHPAIPLFTTRFGTKLGLLKIIDVSNAIFWDLGSF